MFRLIYVSTASLGLTDTDLSNILKEATATNTQRGITGVLLFNGLNFLQLLEGEQTDVLDVYNRIVRDDRHTSVVTVLQEPAEERVFGEWSMLLKLKPSTAKPDFGPDGGFAELMNREMPPHLSRVFGNFDTLKG
ncbi:BLUF domain-containing protein [uncultured Hyphomonas sp.]|uniref:BLUF domain-containing protein n=1 Tax=uncultured Hyphomonas sp. TaxID=225298 RepID=UPI002AAAB507|nr:BLUF domain-containing protein [uncultured Hyphomonas sp.]